MGLVQPVGSGPRSAPKKRVQQIRKMMLLAVVAAMAALMLSATPALADDRDGDGWDEDFGFWIFVPVFVEVDVDFDGIDDNFDCDFVFCDFDEDFFDEEDDFCDFFDCDDDFEEFCEDFDGDFFCDDFDRFDDGFGDFEQEAESGDVDQSFDVSNSGDNSNQSVAIQGVANTGNAQNQIGITQFDGNNFDEDDFCDEFDEFCEDLDEFCEDFDGDGFCDFFDDFDGFGTGDFEFEDVGASIEVSPTLTFESDQQVNQSATAFGKKGWW